MIKQVCERFTDQAYMDCYELCLVQNEKEIAEIFANR